MRVIDKENWLRREHYEVFSGFKFPHVNICVPIDVSGLWQKRKQLCASPTTALVYVVTRAANRVPELRQRIHEEEVVEHAVIHPQVSVLGDNDLFSVRTIYYDPDFASFAALAEESFAQENSTSYLEEFPYALEDEFSRDDLLMITILPWLAFTSFSITRSPADDAIPLVGIGKVHDVQGSYMMPFFVNIHHALADGLHVARYVKYIEEEAQQLAESI